MEYNLYIDTNIYLTFYHYSSEDLEELKKLIPLIDAWNIILYLPEQTINEFYRNREIKIHDALEKLKNSKLINTFPVLCRPYQEYTDMKNALKKYEENKKSLLGKIQHDAETWTLLADEIINELIKRAVKIDTTAEILSEWVNRYNVGNPPWKDRSYGDAINWVSLLKVFPDRKELIFISEDKDFYSVLNNEKFNNFLLREWEEKKKSKITYYKKLSGFFKDNFPDIELSNETEKDMVIKNLNEASNFDSSKKIIRKLLLLGNFSSKQINEVTFAFVNNNQIYWIWEDSVVISARKNIIEPNRDLIDSELYNEYNSIYYHDDIIVDDLPF